MNISEAMKQISGIEETMEIGGQDVILYPLTYEEYLKAIQMAPKGLYTAQELQEYERSGELPLKLPDSDMTVQALKQQMYVIGVTLGKNDPSFDIAELGKNMRMFYAFQPIYQKVWAASTPDAEMIKKKDLV